MKVKLLKKLRKLAKKAITIECEVYRNDIKYFIYKNKSFYCQCNPKGNAIDDLIKARRGYILQQIDNIRKDMLNKELSKI